MPEPQPILPTIDVQHDVLVIPSNLDISGWSRSDKITLELLDEMGKVIWLDSLAKPAVIKVR